MLLEERYQPLVVIAILGITVEELAREIGGIERAERLVISSVAPIGMRHCLYSTLRQAARRRR